jgi:mRNA interferase HicA
MKYSELHRKIIRNGWKFLSAEGSHYFYEKDGKESPPVPFHGSKEIGEGLRKKLIREMGLTK